MVQLLKRDFLHHINVHAIYVPNMNGFEVDDKSFLRCYLAIRPEDVPQGIFEYV